MTLSTPGSAPPCRLVHGSTGDCLLFKGDGAPGAGSCAANEAKLTYTKGRGVGVASTANCDCICMVGLCTLYRSRQSPSQPFCPCPSHADKLIKSGNSLLSVGASGGLVWSSAATLSSRIVVDAILDGDTIDDFAMVCSDSARKAYG